MESLGAPKIYSRASRDSSSPAAECAGGTLKRSPPLRGCVAHALQDDEKSAALLYWQGMALPHHYRSTACMLPWRRAMPCERLFSILFSVPRRTSVRRLERLKTH